MWAFLDRKNEMSEAYQFELCNLSAAAVKALEELGVDVKSNDEKPEKGSYIVYKSKNYPFIAQHPDGEVIKEKVANGSKAQVVTDTYEWKFKNKKGVSPSCKKLVITDLIVYGEAQDAEDFDDVVL